MSGRSRVVLGIVAVALVAMVVAVVGMRTGALEGDTTVYGRGVPIPADRGEPKNLA